MRLFFRIFMTGVILFAACSEDGPVSGVDDTEPPGNGPPADSIVCDSLNVAPSVEITIPVWKGLNPAIVTHIVEFECQTSDPDNANEEVYTRWAVVDTRNFGDNWQATIDYLRKDPDVLNMYGKTEEDSEDEWSGWARNDSGAGGRVTIPLHLLDYGPYIFAVQARDTCGGFNEALIDSLNVRRVRVPSDYYSSLTVHNPQVGTIVTSVCNTPVVIASVAPGVPLYFRWEGTLSLDVPHMLWSRYGWDVVDLNDDSQWDVDFTEMVGDSASAPPRTWYSGTHTFSVQMIDVGGFCNLVEVKFNIVP